MTENVTSFPLPTIPPLPLWYPIHISIGKMSIYIKTIHLTILKYAQIIILR